MAATAADLVERGIALRYQFPYMERGGSRKPIRSPWRTVRRPRGRRCGALPGVPLVAGGRSFGGRMTSQAQASSPSGVTGLSGLHPAGKPSDERAAHLDRVDIPMLFLTGTRDDLADLALLRPVVQRLGARATLHLVAHADHSFHVLARSGRTGGEVRTEVADALAGWIASEASA